ncbi:MAG: amino acid ABC transporter permease [Candidatus Gastranaerophilales bacterium]|nr:amino acid ABC transporter permease [Candidatus Gastranaerophilales bacterium]
MPFLLNGFKVTIILSFYSIIFSLILGIILGVVRFFKIPVISFLCACFIELTRSIPLILYIVFIHYTISPYLFNTYNITSYLGLNSVEIQTALISLTLFTSAYIAEIVRSGMENIDRQQIWDAKSLGFSTLQTIKYIVLPVVLAKSLPSWIAQFASLIKDTSLVSVIGLVELTRASEIISEITRKDFIIMLFTLFTYFIICFVLSKLAQYLNKKYNHINV